MRSDANNEAVLLAQLAGHADLSLEKMNNACFPVIINIHY